MIFLIFKRVIAYPVMITMLILSLFSLNPPELSADDVKTGNAGDALTACHDNMNKLVPKVKFNNRKNYLNFIDIQRRIKRINNAIDNNGILYSPDATFDNISRKKLDEMLSKENKTLDSVKESIILTQKEIDEMTAEAVKAGDASYEKPIICPEKGIYSITQDDKLRYKAKCSVHGSSEEIYNKLYEKSMKNSDPVKFCRGNITAITGACEQYYIEYGTPREWNIEMLIEEDLLQGKCVCPAGGAYTIKGGNGKKINCSCSVHK